MYRTAPEPRAWMPGQEQSWPSAAGLLALFPQLPLKLSPLSSPIPPPCPPLTAALHASPWCRAFTDFLTLLTLYLEVTFFVFSLGMEGLAP